MSILADWMLLFCYLIINGMNVNIGRADVIIFLLHYKWDECEWVRSLQFGGYYYFGPEEYINGMNVNLAYLLQFGGYYFAT
jgi:hypothetical protein